MNVCGVGVWYMTVSVYVLCVVHIRLLEIAQVHLKFHEFT